MPRTLRRSAQRLLHLVIITSLVLTVLGPASPPHSLAAAPERRYLLPAFDPEAELAGLPPEAPGEATARAASALPDPEVPPEPEAPDVVPAILLASVDPPLAMAGELVAVTVVVSAEGDLPEGTLASDLPQGVTFASTLGERTLFLAADRELQHPLSTVAYDLTCGNRLTVTEIISGAVYRRTVTDYYPNADAWIVDRPARTSVYDAEGNPLGQNHTIYDNPANGYESPPVRGDPVATVQLASLDPEEWITQTVTYITRTVAYGEPRMLDGVLVTPTVEYTQTLPVISTDALGRETVTDYDDTWTRVLTVTPPCDPGVHRLPA